MDLHSMSRREVSQALFAGKFRLLNHAAAVALVLAADGIAGAKIPKRV